MYQYYTWKAYPTSYIPLELSDATQKQMAKLMGKASSPTSVNISIYDKENDDFRNKINRMTTYFLNETIRYTLIHMEHCCSMIFSVSDVNFGIEHFAKEYEIYLTWSSDDKFSMTSEDLKGGLEDEDWTSSTEDDNQMEDFDGCMNDTMEVSPGGTWQEIDDDEDEESFVVTKPGPSPFQTQIFDSTFPPLEESDSFFKISNAEFEKLATDVLEKGLRNGLSLCGRAAEILRYALLRYVVDQLRVDICV